MAKACLCVFQDLLDTSCESQFREELQFFAAWQDGVLRYIQYIHSPQPGMGPR